MFIPKITNNLPNLLTSLRFALTPIFLNIFYFQFLFPEKKILEYFTILLFFGICLSDILDGFLARRNGITSTFGMYFDISADFFFRFSTLLLFSYLKILPLYLVVVYSIFFIEFIIISKINNTWNITSGVNIFRKTAPVLYTLFIGVIIFKDLLPDAISQLINLSKISYIMLVITLLAVVENLVFFVIPAEAGIQKKRKCRVRLRRERSRTKT